MRLSTSFTTLTKYAVDIDENKQVDGLQRNLFISV